MEGCRALLHGMFLTQGSNPRLFSLSALAGGFFPTGATCMFPSILLLDDRRHPVLG